MHTRQRATSNKFYLAITRGQSSHTYIVLCTLLSNNERVPIYGEPCGGFHTRSVVVATLHNVGLVTLLKVGL